MATYLLCLVSARITDVYVVFSNHLDIGYTENRNGWLWDNRCTPLAAKDAWIGNGKGETLYFIRFEFLTPSTLSKICDTL